MRDISKEQIERKTLSEECWIELGDFQIKVDYPTYSQVTELRRLTIMWEAQRASEDTEHFLGYYLRSTLKGVKGLVADGKELTVELERGLAKNFVGGSRPLDIVATFLAVELLEIAVVRIRERLEVSNEDKKKSSSQPSSLKKVESGEPRSSTPVLKFETPSTQLQPMVENDSFAPTA